MADYHEKAQRFLKVASEFRLGQLPTEQPHPSSSNLSELAVRNLDHALAILKGIDLQALYVLAQNAMNIHRLSVKINLTLQSKRRVYICGCDSGGRIALLQEALWRQRYLGQDIAERVIGFMAGCDAGIVRSVANFEDHAEYGQRHLLELGFSDGDLLIGICEDGETPFVIGAIAAAAKISSNSPFFLYCNPNDILCAIAKRSRYIIENPAIEKINLSLGPMALAGCTRMQAATVLMAAVGLAFFYHRDMAPMLLRAAKDLVTLWERLDISFLKNFIEMESAIYASGEYVLYTPDERLAITILSDIAERSLAFGVSPIENNLDPLPRQPSPFFMHIPNCKESLDAWKVMLKRNPRTLSWPDLDIAASKEWLAGFDFSTAGLTRRQQDIKNAPQRRFCIVSGQDGIYFSLGKCAVVVPVGGYGILFEHLILKMLLNNLSTLVMGRLGRFTGNIMSWQRMGSNKLIDRVVRNCDIFLKRLGIELSYEDLVYECFRTAETLPAERSVVIETVKRIAKK